VAEEEGVEEREEGGGVGRGGGGEGLFLFKADAVNEIP
jgi:hypothetical protein